MDIGLRHARVLFLVGLTGCGTDPASSREEGLTAGSDELTVVDAQGDRRLLRGSPSATVPQTDERPTYRMRVEGAETIEPGEPVLGAALVQDGAVWVTPAFELVDEQGAILDRDVLPELAVSADGLTVAYPHRAGEGAGVYVVSRDGAGWSAPHRVTDALAFADRPLFLEGGRLIVVGSVVSGIAGVWIFDPAGTAQPIAVTNATLRTGHPLGPTFVPPPAFHESMHVEGDVLTYDDGYGERRVTLGGVR